MDEKILRGYWEVFVRVWKLFRKYRNLRTDADRKQLLVEATEIYNQYPGMFAHDLIWAVFKELDRRAKQK